MSGLMGSLQSSLQGVLGNLKSTFFSLLNRIFSPEQRAEMMEKLKSFAMNNPKLAAFLTTQILLTGFPLFLFITFSITVALFSLIAALLIGLLAAVLFTLFMIGAALIVVLPTVFFTTFAASFLFLWGLGGYYALKWLNEGEMPAEPGKAIGDKINNLTGGRMSWLMDGSRQKQEDKANGVSQTPKAHEHGKPEEQGSTNPSGPPKLNSAKDTSSQGKENINKQADGAHNKAGKPTEGAQNAGGTAKGAANGVTG